MNGQFSGVAAVAEKSASFQEVGDSLDSDGSKRSRVLKVKVADARWAAFVKPDPEAMMVSALGLRRSGRMYCKLVKLCRIAGLQDVAG